MATRTTTNLSLEGFNLVAACRTSGGCNIRQTCAVGSRNHRSTDSGGGGGSENVKIKQHFVQLIHLLRRRSPTLPCVTAVVLFIERRVGDDLTR